MRLFCAELELVETSRSRDNLAENQSPDEKSQDNRHGNVQVNVLPSPGTLSTFTEPPWSSTIILTTVSPRPCPPARRSYSQGTWKKRSKIRSWNSGAIPTPVSRTCNFTTGTGSSESIS